MSTEITKIYNQAYYVEALRYSGPAHESKDRIRLFLTVGCKDGTSMGISLDRKQWIELRDEIDDAFMEFPVK